MSSSAQRCGRPVFEARALSDAVSMGGNMAHSTSREGYPGSGTAVLLDPPRSRALVGAAALLSASHPCGAGLVVLCVWACPYCAQGCWWDCTVCASDMHHTALLGRPC